MHRLAAPAALLFALLSATACGPTGGGPGGGGGVDAAPPDAGAVPATDEASGSRIDLVWLETADGDRYGYGVQDADLGESCSFRAMGDGELHCLPYSYGYASDGVGGYYADAFCDGPPLLRFSATACTPTPPARILAPDECGGSRVFALGTPVGAATVYSRGVGETCTPIDVATWGPFYQLGTEVPPDEFVGGTADVGGSGRLRTVHVDGDDGSRTLLATHDAELDADCYMDMSQPEPICLPSAALYDAPWYGDDACSAPLARVESYQALCNIDYALVGDTCGPRRAYRIGGPADGGTHYELDGSGECSGWTAYGEVYALGEEVALATASVVVEGSGAVRRRRAQAEDGSRHGGMFWDTERERACSFLPEPDGELHCIGLEARVEELYADETCTQPLLLATYYPPGCGGPAVPRDAYRLVQDGCTYRFAQYAIGAQVANPVAYRKYDTDCYEETFSLTAQVYAVGADVTAERPAAAVVVE